MQHANDILASLRASLAAQRRDETVSNEISTPAFAPLRFHNWRRLAELANRRLVPHHELVSFQDETPGVVLIVESGIVKLLRINSDGSEYIAGLRSDGWILDAPGAMLNRPATFSAITV